MSTLLIPDLDPVTLGQLRERASQHGRSVEGEAKAILEQAASASSADVWAEVDVFRHRLAGSGRQFSDSAELIREDRER